MKNETRKEEITRIAAKLFKEKGFSAVTMRDLATSVGIKAASLYNHIKSKQEILQVIIISLAEEFTEGMDLIKTSDKSAIDQLRQIVQLHVKIASNNSYGMASLNNDWMHLGDKLDYYLKLRTDYEHDFRTIIKNGILNHEIAKGNIETILFSILSTLRSLYLWIPKKEDVNTEKLSSELCQILINGIKN